jgi:hypothetical protein
MDKWTKTRKNWRKMCKKVGKLGKKCEKVGSRKISCNKENPHFLWIDSKKVGKN